MRNSADVVIVKPMHMVIRFVSSRKVEFLPG